LAFVKLPADYLNSFRHYLVRFNLPFRPRNGAGDSAVLLDSEMFADLFQAVSLEGAGEIDGDVAGIVGDSARG